MDYQSPLAKARGLGSAKSGVGHWWLQRVTALALIPLSFWAIQFISLMIYSDYSQTVSWLKSPLHSAALAAWLIAACYHAALGLQVVIEDYIAHEARKILLVWLSHLTFSLLALVALIALFRILFTG